MSREYPIVPLKDVLHLFNDPINIDPISSYPIAGVYSFGRGLFARQSLSGSETTYKIFHRLHRDDFVLSQLKGWEGALARVSNTFDGWFLSPQFQSFRAVSERINNGYLDWYLKQSKVWEELKGKSRGMGARRDTVYPNQFLSLTIPLPPLEEQRRIVARIEELAAKIEEARGLRREANSSDDIYTSTIASLINTNNKGWQQCKVENVILSIDAGWSPQCLDQPAKANQWGILKTTSVQWSEFFSRENKELPSYLTAKPELSIQKGDVLITRAGPQKRVGVVVTIKKDEPYLMISDKLIRLRTDLSRINPEYLELALSSPSSQEFLIKNKTGLADAQVNISQSILRNTPIMYPSLEEQKDIVKRLRDLKLSIEKIKKYQNETSDELNALLPSILDKAFKGEL